MHKARQMGFKDKKECPNLCKLASNYIKKAEGCENDVFEYFASEPDADSLFIKMVEEFERCILSYFAFHWKHTSYMISQACAPIYLPALNLNLIRI
ncbi:UNVERIFIED_CONTAM: Calmodulin calcium-dependent NAD kinase [Sesamum radiatum]|uniref:Calmodulin calcium-dependent NAD kinase n=1 Tax=Sesamum radiatum TaxID=300843 RepID=A0AAW2W726_SESRA